MQKKLIALAVASIVSAPAFAQSNVTIYGVLDAGVESIKYSDSVGSLTRMFTSGNTTNRFGFKGSEDLGNGMKANFVLEMQPYPDVGTAGSATAGNGNLWHRTSTIGLSGNSWGSVNLGSQYTPWFSARASNDIFYTAGVASNYTVTEAQNTRMSNSIRYDSVSMNGFTVAAMYGFGQAGGYDTQEGTTAANKNVGQDTGLWLNYANGPLALRYGYDHYKVSQGPDVVNKANWLGGSYDFKVVKLVAGWGSRKNDASPAATIDNKSWYVGGVLPIGANDLVKAQYNALKDNTATAATGSKDLKMFALGYEHFMSKRTTLYANYAKITNDQGAAGTFLSDNAVAVAAGYDPSAFQVGVKHSF